MTETGIVISYDSTTSKGQVATNGVVVSVSRRTPNSTDVVAFLNPTFGEPQVVVSEIRVGDNVTYDDQTLLILGGA